VLGGTKKAVLKSVIQLLLYPIGIGVAVWTAWKLTRRGS
jgi:hypothetical protein